jgi:hypothetical protein
MFKNAKDWKTTVAGIIAAVLVIAGILYPEKIDPATQATINTAAAEILSGVGALIAVIGGLLAKD